MSLATGSQGQHNSPQGPPDSTGSNSAQFKSGLTLVPLNVRVLDRQGVPVVDLTEDDFEVLEDGVPQRIVQFARVGRSLPAAAATAADGRLISPNPRIFLIVLGRGRLTGPSRELDALSEFCRQRLRPDDQVAVMAYNRATRFIRDPGAMARFFEQYQTRHEEIEGLLEQWFSGLRARYGNADIPPFIQKKIDALFEGVDGRHRDSTGMPRADRPPQRVHEISDRLQRAALLSDRESGLPDPEVERTIDAIGMDFDQFVDASSRTLWDLANVHKGIEYLHYASGEKHLLFVTTRGLFLPGLEREESLSAAASDARVTLDILYTGGPAGAPPATAKSSAAVPTATQAFQQMFAVSDMRAYAEATGGGLTAFRPAAVALERLDEATRSFYLLGYEPADSRYSGKFRRITVRVKRQGARVLHRGGYYARSRRSGFDARGILTYTRIASAGGRALPLLDIPLKARATTTRESGGVSVALDATIGIAALDLAVVEGRHVGTLEVAVFCGDQRETVVCETWQKVDLNLASETRARYAESGLPHTMTLTAARSVKYVKLVVYHYESDLTGSITITID